MTAEEIVKGFAECDPGDGGDGHRELCIFCGCYVREQAWTKDGTPLNSMFHARAHNADCLWRIAVQYTEEKR